MKLRIDNQIFEIDETVFNVLNKLKSLNVNDASSLIQEITRYSDGESENLIEQLINCGILSRQNQRKGASYVR